MLITAKHDGLCVACSGPVTAGRQCDFDRNFGARCLTCLEADKYPPTRNKLPAYCARCGRIVRPGEGTLTREERRWVVRCRVNCRAIVERG